MIKKIKSKKAFLLGMSTLAVIMLVSVFLVKEQVVEYNEENQELESTIEIFSPRPNETISFPLRIEGEATSDWYEDGRFAVRVLSEVGTVITNAVAESTEPVKEDGYTPFSLTIEKFDTTDWDFGTLMFLKSDPFQYSSKDQVVFPVNFPKGD